MKHLINLFILTAVLFFPASGEEWTLDQTISFALENNTQLVNKEREIAQAKNEILAAYGDFLPTVSASGLKVLKESVSTFSLPGPGGTTMDYEMDMLSNYQYSLSANLPLFTGGARFFSLKTVYARWDIAKQEYRKARMDVIYAVSEAYYNVIYAGLMKDLARETVEILEEQKAMVETQYNNGEASNLELLQARVELNNARPDALKAESGYKMALMSLKNIVGAAEEIELTVSREFAVDEERLLPEKSLMMDLALSNNPDIQILKINSAIVDYSKSMSKGQYLPSLVLSGTYGQQKEEWGQEWEDSYNITLALQWNLFQGLKRPVGIKNISLQQEILDDTYRDIIEKTGIDLSLKLESVREARERLDAQKTNLSLARESLEVARAGYKEGVVSLLELMQARIGYNNAKAGDIRARYDLNLSWLKLRKAAGILEKEEAL
ncbi:MAG TPA: TolC family protein [Candidatus Mcinerneyibacteriales bacterium]|nr:TolC family protein [Candidatus Mcinerneyibacteriales bacterium]HPJ69783.1 TolC family protein [Candidatus Mcinerneyibacteriales bacterium]HPQ88505.1 TolC family protein [Candidatus Mcinerneyibacteriales bacterium]